MEKKKGESGLKDRMRDEWNLKEKLIYCAASNSRVVPIASMQDVMEFSSIYIFVLLTPHIA